MSVYEAAHEVRMEDLHDCVPSKLCCQRLMLLGQTLSVPAVSSRLHPSSSKAGVHSFIHINTDSDSTKHQLRPYRERIFSTFFSGSLGPSWNRGHQEVHVSKHYLSLSPWNLDRCRRLVSQMPHHKLLQEQWPEGWIGRWSPEIGNMAFTGDVVTCDLADSDRLKGFSGRDVEEKLLTQVDLTSSLWPKWLLWKLIRDSSARVYIYPSHLSICKQHVVA